MRLVESVGAGVVAGLVAAVIAWRVDAAVVLLGAAAFLVGFGAWATTGRTVAKYGRTSRRRRRR